MHPNLKVEKKSLQREIKDREKEKQEEEMHSCITGRKLSLSIQNPAAGFLAFFSREAWRLSDEVQVSRSGVGSKIYAVSKDPSSPRTWLEQGRFPGPLCGESALSYGGFW